MESDKILAQAVPPDGALLLSEEVAITLHWEAERLRVWWWNHDEKMWNGLPVFADRVKKLQVLVNAAVELGIRNGRIRS